MHATETEKAYLAGLIDGEGHVAVSRTHTNASAKSCKRGFAYRLILSVRMTDRMPLDFAVRVTSFGKVVGRKISRGGRRQPFDWTIWSRQAAHVLFEIFPYLLVKKQQAEIAIQFQKTMRFPGKLGLTDQEWDARERSFFRSKELNYG